MFPTVLALFALFSAFGGMGVQADLSLGVRQANGTGGDAQTSLTLLTSQVQSALASNGLQNGTAEAGTVASLTSVNNFINWCATQNASITNGKQLPGCNPTIMGMTLAENKLPSAKFQSPKNLDTVQAGKPFTVKIAISNVQTGFFSNSATNYLAAPAQVTSDGTLIGHCHIVIEMIESLTSTTVTDPTKFVFFSPLNSAADSAGVLSVNVTNGLPQGAYRMGSILSAENHQPPLSAVAQRGLMDDVIYFTVTQSGASNAAARTSGFGLASVVLNAVVALLLATSIQTLI